MTANGFLHSHSLPFPSSQYPFFLFPFPIPINSASSISNSVCVLWISTKYRTLHYLNITYRHTYYNVHTLPCAYLTVLQHKRLKNTAVGRRRTSDRPSILRPRASTSLPITLSSSARAGRDSHRWRRQRIASPMETASPVHRLIADQRDVPVVPLKTKTPEPRRRI